MTHADLPDAKPGDEYRYLVRSGESGRRQYNKASGRIRPAPVQYRTPGE
jgi:hypothetical protein